MTTLRNIECAGYLGDSREHFVVDNAICADNPVTNERLYSGAFGTALVSSKNNLVIGIASVIFYEINNPDVFVRVAPYIDWINSVMRAAAVH